MHSCWLLNTTSIIEIGFLEMHSVILYDMLPGQCWQANTVVHALKLIGLIGNEETRWRTKQTPSGRPMIPSNASKGEVEKESLPFCPDLLTYLLSPLRACSHIRPTPRNAIVFCPLPVLRPGPNSTREPSSLAPRTFSMSLLVVPSSCFRRGSSAWLFLE